MNIFTKDGLKFAGILFSIGFVVGLVTGVAGFTMAIDIMAGR